MLKVLQSQIKLIGLLKTRLSLRIKDNVDHVGLSLLLLLLKLLMHTTKTQSTFLNKKLLIVPQLPMDTSRKDVMVDGWMMVSNMLSRTRLLLNRNIHTKELMEHAKEVKLKTNMLSNNLLTSSH